MATNYEQTIYQPRLKEAHEYQDYVAMQLCREGLVLVNFGSKKYQYDYGENMMGLEIKLDREFAKTGNLWIEVAEKTDPDKPSYFQSGIRRDDNSWLYGIGNFEEFFIFSKRTLREYQDTQHVRIQENGLRTSQGFLLPRRLAAELADRTYGPWVGMKQPKMPWRDPGEEG